MCSYRSRLLLFVSLQSTVATIPAHDSPLAALAFNTSATKLASASEKVRQPELSPVQIPEVAVGHRVGGGWWEHFYTLLTNACYCWHDLLTFSDANVPKKSSFYKFNFLIC